MTQNMAQNIDDESWNPRKLSIDPYASPFNHTYQADDHENLQGHISSLVCKTAANGLPVYVSEDQPQRTSARLGEKEAAGKKVTWEPRTQAPMEWDTAPTSLTRATGVPLARQAQPSSPPPPQPSIIQDPSSNRRADKPDYGRSGDGVKFPVTFTPEPFGDLEPSTTNENEPPSE